MDCAKDGLPITDEQPSCSKNADEHYHVACVEWAFDPRPLVCSVCSEAEGTPEFNCPLCINVVVVYQTQDILYCDGIWRPHTELLPLCLDCRMTFNAWGDIIVAA